MKLKKESKDNKSLKIELEEKDKKYVDLENENLVLKNKEVVCKSHADEFRNLEVLAEFGMSLVKENIVVVESKKRENSQTMELDE